MSTKNPHKVTIRENTGATKAKAPYLGKYASNGTDRNKVMFPAAAKASGQEKIQTQAILEGVFAAITKKNLTDGPTRMHLPGGISTLVGIGGSFPNADSTFDPSRNTIEQIFMLDSSFRNTLADETPTIVNDASITDVQFDRVFDTEVKKPQSVIYGQRAARAQGKNIVTTDEDARVYMLNAKGATFPCTVLEVVSSQEFTFKTDALLEGGDYWVVIETRGGNPDGNIQKVRKPVKYLKIAPAAPRATKMYTPSHEDEGKVAVHASMLYVIGSGLSGLTKDDVTFTLNGEALTIPSSATWTVTDTQIEINNGIEDMINGAVDDTIEVTITKSGFDPVTLSTTLAE